MNGRVPQRATGHPKATRKQEPTTRLAPLTQRLLDGIQLLARRLAIVERADIRCCGLTVAQSATLEVLGAEGPLQLSALAARLGIAPSTLTRGLARLEHDGLVARERDAADTRAVRVRLTASGCRAARQVDSREEELARRVLARLPEGRREAVLDALDDLVLAVREATDDASPGAFEHLMTDCAGCCPRTHRGG